MERSEAKVLVLPARFRNRDAELAREVRGRVPQDVEVVVVLEGNVPADLVVELQRPLRLRAARSDAGSGNLRSRNSASPRAPQTSPRQ